MKTMKKFWTAICSFLFVLALGFGITLNANVKAKAATSANANITYACVEYSADDGTGVPTTYTLVAGLTTSAAYDTYVYVDGVKTTATVNWGNFYIDHSAFECNVGDTVLLEIPAGTYYQTDAYLASEVKMFLTLTNSYTDPDSGAYQKQGILTITDASNIISEEPYSIQLNRKDWAMNASNASNLYITIPDADNTIKSGVTTEDWTNGAIYAPLGNVITVNGVAINKNIQKVYADPSEDAYLQLANVSQPGDVLTFDGWFYNATQGAFRIEKTSFIYDGKSWDEENSGAYSFDVSTTSDANPQNGFYLSMEANHIPVSTDNNGWTYSTRPVGTNFYGYYNSTNVEIKLRKFSTTDWYVALNEASINEASITATAGDTVSFGGWYVCTDASSVQHFIKLNQASYQFDGTKWTETTPTISVSVGGTPIENDTLYVAPGQLTSAVTATASNGNTVTMNFGEAVSDGKFVLRSGESTSDYLATFSVTDSNGVIYRKNVAVTVGFEDFVMENGAAVRVDGENVNGLRFSAELSVDTYNSLKAQGATFGMVIVPRDYITEGYELTATNLFGANAKYSATATAGASEAVRKMLLLDGLTPTNKDNDGNYEIYGSITDILTNNLTREFVGVAYVYVNGEYIVASYYGDDMDNNARSIYYVSQRAIDANDNVSAVQEKYIDVYDAYVSAQGKTYNVKYTVNHIKTRKGTTEVETETATATLNSTVEIAAKNYDGFALSTGVAGVTIKLYANKANVFDFYYKDTSLPDMDVTAWHHPKLDATDNYMNDTNKAIVETMRDAGFTSVMLNGSHTVGDLYLNSSANIETMKNIINMYWTYGGITTYVSGKNAGATDEYVSLEDYQTLETEMATLTDCEGFGGFFAWDEPLPNAASFERIAEYATWFDGLYGDEALFMVNLFPSYYDGWSSGDYTSYSDYIKAYCDIVLPNIVNGTKYLSMDSYPVCADGTLSQTFMYDIAVLKHYALQYDAQANAILQACGWTSTNNNVVPTEAQYRMMYYTALAFGMDSVGWWGYSPESDNPTVILPEQTPVKIDNTTTEAYDAIKNVNTEVGAFGPIYKTYAWQGVIMSSPNKGFLGIGKDAQYDAFNAVKSDSLLSSYMLSASNTSSFSSISGSGSNYVVGVMKDNNNNEAFTVVNYSAPTDNKTLSITFKANADGQYVIYQGGEQTTVDITTSGYTLTLAPGEGVFIMNANTTHSVTFKDWDGTVLYETTCQVGNTPVYGVAEPTRDGYTFTGWTPALGAITGDTVYTATYKGLPTITFQNWDGTVLQQSTWAYGSTPIYSGATPTKDGFEFAGWSPAITTVTGDAVYTATFNEQFTVTYLNYDGTTGTKTAKIDSGNTVSYVPTLEGYLFKGWTLNGAAYDMSAAVKEDITLVATWYKVLDEGVDEVISAQTVLDGVQLETGYGYKEEAVAANPNAGWYFDADYHCVTGANNTDDNKFANWVKFTLTYDGGAGTSDTGRETYLVMPAINYKLYSKVDFAYTNNANIKALSIYGTEVSQYGGNNKLISIVTDESGTKLYFREINSVSGDVTVGADAVIELPESVANGSEGLKLNITVGGWFKFAVTEMHATVGAVDYMTAIDEAVATLESDPTNADALNKYSENVGYMTAYEKANHTVPDAVISAQENALYNGVVNATAGSDEQAAAITEYSKFITENANARNNEHIAAINTIIYENFYELEGEQILLNDPTVDTTRGAVDQDERIQTGWGGHSTDYNTSYETYVHMIQFTSGDYDSTVTLPAINYNAYAKAYFGLRAITADGTGTITIGDGSKSFDNSKNHNWKVTIVGNILTVSDDNKDNNDGGGVLWTTTISDDVANGTTGLVIDFNFEAWSQAEITEMHVTAFTMTETTSDNVPSGWTTAGTRVANFTTAYTATKQKTFDSGTFDGTATLPAFNYNAYEEVYFGVHAIAGATSWDPYVAENGIITINGASYGDINPQNGDYYFKATVANGVLTLVVEKANNVATGLVALTVKLPENVANGTESLVIDFNFGAWSQAEITELHAKSFVRTIVSTVENNAVTMEMSGTTVGSSLQYKESTFWGTGAHTAFNTSYTSQNLVSFNAADSAYTATFTLPKFAFADYSEAYFGFTAATAAGNTTVTVGGGSYTYDLNAGYVYVKMLVKDGVLTVIGDGASNAGTVYMTVALSEAVLNGSEALTIGWSTAGWSQVEITEIQTNTWIDALA